MKSKITITLDPEQHGHELATELSRILHDLANEVASGVGSHTLHTSRGAECGQFILSSTTPPHAPPPSPHLRPTRGD